MKLYDEVYVINENEKDSGIHGVVTDVYSDGFISNKGYKVAINGDFNNTINVQEEKLRKKNKTYKLGTRIKINTGWSGNTYVLSRTGHKNEVNLVNIDTGGIWDDPIKVKDLFSITESELEELAKYSAWETVQWEVVE